MAVILEAPDDEDTHFGLNLDIVVVNHGSRTAYDVEVVVDVVHPTASGYFNTHRDAEAIKVPVGSWSRENSNYRLRWTIPALGGLQREEFTTEIVTRETTSPAFDKRKYTHEFFGEVTTSSVDRNPGNNTSRVWSVPYSAGSLNSHGGSWALGNYVVAVTVDNPSPSPGDTVNFTIAADKRVGLLFLLPIDLGVDIELTDGLSVSGAPSYVSKNLLGVVVTRPDSVSYINGEFTVGTLKFGDGSINSVTLPVRVASSAVVNKQCLTATLTGNPPPGTGPRDDDVSDNVAKLCLASTETSVSSHFNIYPCVGNSNSPCDNSDDVRIRAIGEIGGTKQNLGPGTALVHSPDKSNREYDSHANSVNGGDIVSWQIPVIWDASEINAVSADWSNLRDGFAASGPNGGAPPGKVHIRAFEGDTSEITYKMTSEVGWMAEDTVGYDPGATGNGPFEYTAEFEKLGTYKLQFTAKLTRATLDGEEDCEPNTSDPPVNQSFCATETYTFHVGPMAELEVRDGGASSHVPPNRDALTIVAVNNGPDEPSGGARITGLPTEAEVIHISHGSYNSSTGVWSIDRLRLRDYYRPAGMSEPTLVLGASAGDSASVRIASAKNYEVCVGPKDNPGDLEHTTQAACEAVTNASWNSVPVYDYKPGNNSATINARAGTGAALPAMPATEAITAIRVTWAPVTEVNGRQVTHYDVQRRTNPWETVAKVLDPVYHDLVDAPDADSEPVSVEYLDWNVELGDIHEYRIRAVNDQDYSGPWSSSVEGTVPLPPEPVAVVRPPITEPVRILRIEPSISEVSLKGGSVVRLAVEVYGRQDLRDDSLGDRSDVTFDWTLEEFGAQPGGTVGQLVGTESSRNDRTRTSTLDGRRGLYIAPDSPGRFRITVSLDPGTECLPKQSFETEEEAQDRCTAVFEVTALRSSQIETATLDPRNPEGEIPHILADSDGLQYEVFTPVSGGAFVHESASLTAGAGAVPDYDMIGLRISEVGPASNEGMTYGRYTLGGDWYAITAVDASGWRVEESYELNDVLDVCVPLPAELSSNISEVAMVAMDSDDSLTILSSRVRITASGTKVCGHLSTVPATVAVGTAGAPRPVPTAVPEPFDGTGSPDTGGWAPPSQTVVLWMALIGLTVLVGVLGVVVVWRRKI
ncbi:MAG: hypothetical protein F4Y63_02615 [Chloroflexi bacterium]|nr:hypothetical protein [Chloroflexota bacterium]MYK61779.1 hypothetical protein [Chloroflexota bacterium]